MRKQKVPTIVVLGAQGMLGHTVYSYLLQKFPHSTFGTIKENEKNSAFMQFDCTNPTSLKKLLTVPGEIDYIINCIGILPANTNQLLMKSINSIFPNTLNEFAQEHTIKVIHISSDAVFPANANTVDESVQPKPDTFYGETKLQGEINSKSFIAIRTSILGLDPRNQRGLLESTYRNDELYGYTNHIWSGCTTLQYAELCFAIIDSQLFEKMRKKSPVFHFSPIKGVSKHAIIKTFLTLIQSNKIITMKQSSPVNRILISKYSQFVPLFPRKKSLKKALTELIAFENTL